MDIFHKKKIIELETALRKEKVELRDLNNTLKVYLKQLEQLTKETNSLSKKNTELVSTIQDLQTINVKLDFEKSQIEQDFKSSQQKLEEELSYSLLEQKIIKINQEHALNIDIAKQTKCKELPDRIEADIQKIIEEKEIGFPWLANALSSFYENIDNIYASYLERKTRPALKQAERIREIAKEKAFFKKEFTIMKYTVKYYESLFPWLSEYIGINSDELIEALYSEKTKDSTEDPVLHYIPKGEFNKLSVSERNQKALDRFWSSKKTPWQIGRDYERYIGFLYENEGYRVQYFGIEKGLEDLGRDLVCSKDGIIEVVQCKYWSKSKNIPIRENHINQLFGTTVKHYIDFVHSSAENNLHAFLSDYQKGEIVGTMVTSTILSETAMDFSNTLGIQVKQDVELDFEYPCIKCNINPSTKEKIYHLPFDQQYDKTHIDYELGEFYAKTVKEAERRGFRRAYRWMGK
jgi:predicted nuclease with TOPRIM domain